MMTSTYVDPISISGQARPKESQTNFDLLQDLFVAQSSRPDHLDEVNLRTLSPFQRALLVIDGTVTKFIEAYTLQAIEVVLLTQETRVLPIDHAWLAASQGTEVIARQVLLHGKYNDIIYAHAASLIVPDRLPGEFISNLVPNRKGLGRLLQNNLMETYREILWYGRERPKRLPDGLRHLEGIEFLSRTYRIISNQQPVMVINERFPMDGDLLPAHH